MAVAAVIAQAIGAISSTIGGFVMAGAQRYAFAKGMETETVRFEQQKDLYAYETALQNRRIAMYLIAALAIIVLVIKFRK